MKALWRFIALAAMTLIPISVATAQDKAGQAAPAAPTTVSQAAFPITVGGAEYQLLNVVFDFPPGAGFARHKHGGPAVAAVLSGEMKLMEKGSERIVKAGESWTETPGNEHSVVNDGTLTTRVAVSMLVPKGAEATTMIEP